MLSNKLQMQVVLKGKCYEKKLLLVEIDEIHELEPNKFLGIYFPSRLLLPTAEIPECLKSSFAIIWSLSIWEPIAVSCTYQQQPKQGF